MNSTSPDPVDSAIIRHGSVKNYSFNGSEADDDNTSNSPHIQKYTRSALYLLRNEASSHKRPECALRSELQSLGVWKFYTGNGHQNNNVPNSEGGTNNCNTPSSSGHLNSRIQRSPTTRGVVSSGDYSAVSAVSTLPNHSAQLHQQHSSVQKSYIDHRSISSSHLMPAFAKRRIAATNTSQNILSTAGNLTTYGENSASDPRPVSPTDTKDIPSYSGRQRGKELIKDYRQRSNDDQKKYSSPQRKAISEQDRERYNEDERALAAASPVSVANSRHGQQANLERRIGSGRLLPRDVNWDYHRGQDKEKNSTGSALDKEPVSNHHLQTRGNTGRYNDRTHERGGGFIERRTFDRKGVSAVDDNMRDKYETMNSSNNMHNTRRFASNETSSNVESTSNQYNQQQQQQPSHGRNRRNQYNDRNEEPEWFSGGPTSQHDTIELRGFEEIDEHYSGNKRTMSRKLRENSSSRVSGGGGGGGAISQTTRSAPFKEQQQPPNNAKDLTAKNLDNVTTSVKTIEKSTPSTPHIEKNVIVEENSNTRCETANNNVDKPQKDFDIFDKDLKKDNVAGVPNQTEFNFDAFLNLDPLEHTLMRGDSQTGSNAANTGSSRFSRWFASKTNRDDAQASDDSDIQKLYAGAVIPSVEELEARMRKVDTNDGVSDTSKTKGHEMTMITSSAEGYVQQNHSLSQQPTQDMEAFKKMLEQLGSGNNKQHPAAMHLLVQQANRSPTIPQINMIKPSGGIAPTGIPQPSPLLPHMLKSEEIKKFIQQQQLIHQQQHHQRQKQMQPEVVQQTHQLQQSLSPQILQNSCNEVLPTMPPNVPIFFGQPQKRMEAQHLFQCVARGEISLSFLEQELNNSHTSQHAKEIIVEVLRENSRSVTPSAGIVVPPPQPLHGNVALHQQQILSPLPMLKSVMISGPTEQCTSPQQGHIATSLPSPRDLQFHTQTILQNAVLKKKMEDQQQHQQDALRRRQEIQKQQQQQQQPGIGMTGSSEMCSQKNLQQLQISTGILQTQQQQQTGPQQSHAPQPHSLQQSRHVNSPTPLAFTPTSVLRKMTADKDNSNSLQQSALSAQQHLTQNKPLAQTVFANQQHSHQQQQQVLQQPPPPQPRMILGGNHQQQQHQQQLSNGGPQISPQTISQQQQPPPLQQMRSASQVKWPAHINQNVVANKPMGRPILKGPALPSQQTLQQQHPQQQQQIPQMTFASKLEFQQIQQQRLKNNQTPQHMLNQQSAAAQAFPHPMQQQLSQSNMLAAHAQQQQIFHHQRALALQRQQQLQLHQQLHPHQPQQQQPDTANRLLGIPISSDTSLLAANNAASIINYQRDGGLSPTSNQLAQWFSPELLAQASAGKLPLLNMNQALSLEEFERSIQHSSTAVHN